MTIVEESPAAELPPTPRTTRTPPDSTGSGGFVLALVLGTFAILTLGFIGVLAVALSLGGTSTPREAAVLEVGLSEFAITGDLIAPAGDVTLRLFNEGSMDHNVAVREINALSANIGPGQTTDLELRNLLPGEYLLTCEIPGHEGSGMVATLTITEGGDLPVAAGDGHGGEHGTDPDYAELDRVMIESLLEFPAETEGKGNPVLEPTEIRADGTKVFDLTAEIVDWEVEPGKFVQAWTYNGVVPAPQIKLDRGDRVEVRVVNNLPMGTDIHWHGVHTPNDMDGVSPLTQDLIEGNGGTFTYAFEARDDAIGMYHAHHHGHVQIVNGMFGAITIGENPVPRGTTISGVEIPEDLEFALDMPMVLNDAGSIGLSLNGKSFPATEPIALRQGDWVSVTYYNEGLQIHPMHLHQFPQLVYAKDGIPLDEPYWADTLNVAPGERYTVMFRADDPGVWVWHCHILTHVERDDGMFGMVTAIIVEENPDFDPLQNPVQPSNFRLSPDTADAHADHDHGETA